MGSSRSPEWLDKASGVVSERFIEVSGRSRERGLVPFERFELLNDFPCSLLGAADRELEAFGLSELRTLDIKSILPDWLLLGRCC